MRKNLLTALAITFVPTILFAHSQDQGVTGIVQGLLHPISGIDHVLTMLAIGICAARLDKTARWQIPMAFVAFMIFGFAYGNMGGKVAFLEPMILASMVVIGAMIAMSLRIMTPVMAAIAGFFGIFHGFAHGIEGAGIGFGAGFIITSLLLIGLGFIVANRLHDLKLPKVVQLVGAGISALGLVMMFQ